MRNRTVLGIAVTTTAVCLGVLASVDMSAEALQDPARTLTVGPRGVEVIGRLADRPPFSVTELVVFLAVGLMFVASGITAANARPDSRAGILAVLAGLLWLAGGLRRSSDPLAFTTGVVLTHTYLLVILHSLIGFPDGRLRPGAQRRFVVCAYPVVVGAGVAEWAVFDPIEHVQSGRSTSVNLLLIRDEPLVFAVVSRAVGVLYVGIGVVLLVVLLVRWWHGSRAYRRAFLPLWLAGLARAAVGVWVTALAGGDQVGWVNTWNLYGHYLSTALIPVALFVGLLRNRLAHRDVSTFVVRIGAIASADDDLVPALRAALRDPSLTLWTWSARCSSYVDNDGAIRSLPKDGDGAAVTVLERDHSPVGALIHDEMLRNHPALLAAVRGVILLSLDNRRLREQTLSQLGDLRASRARLAVAGDAERRRVERDLHDGAQQRLLAAAVSLRLAQRHRTGGQPLEDVVAQVAEELDRTLVELRQLARGVHPPILTEQGLVPALRSLAERSHLPTAVTGIVTGRLARTVEAAAYFSVAEALTNATKHAAASRVMVTVRSDQTGLCLAVEDDGRGGAALVPGGGLVGLRDRVEGLDGRLALDSPAGRGTTVTVVLPQTIPKAERG